MRAHTFIQEAGLKRAIEQMNNPNGTFLRGSLSVALYDYGGICLADSYDTTRVGQNTSAWVDDRGRLVFRDYQEALKLGGGEHVLSTGSMAIFSAFFYIVLSTPTRKKSLFSHQAIIPTLMKTLLLILGASWRGSSQEGYPTSIC